MLFLSQNSVNLVEILSIDKLMRSFFSLLVLLAVLVFTPSIAQAKLQFTKGEEGTSYVRSLESLRDLDYQTWQVVVYPMDLEDGNLVLRIVGYPGTLRLDHPTSLEVHAGLKNWNLKDITLSNSKLASDPREAAAEFELSPLINDLSNNRPLRFTLQDVFNDLPIPPYVAVSYTHLRAHET